ncbi:diphthamide biosynthesis enzyme Dph2 [Methanosphaerula palustris]|uniref:2-(3-amino-3-carboxypropyl)histidine synthase n=1 Tax=Methanosphaerula palustris (strain ATCC BAA-1556 / DSM 19958 / E1-9c) TaxID=521011 RepID=B8GDM9_METPE|nr:diphthamide biosynthesis enzyme Dph2 [Methanosphaerula palustris]ACL17380.1 diphthamide biosynthesis protein [Methanosphaerula palustris E1-9c]
MSSINTADLIGELHRRGAHRVALQLPEGLKRQGAGLAGDLKAAGFSVILSGDPCYGACDLALSALAEADVLVHIGHTPVEDHPQVICLPFEQDFDLSSLDQAIPLLQERRIGLITTVQHAHLLAAAAQYLADHGIEAVIRDGAGRTPAAGQVLGCTYRAARIDGVNEILFIGTGLFHPIGVQLATGKRVIALDPFTRNAGVVDSSRLLRRRFGLIEQAKEAESYGILLSTKSGQRRAALAERLASLDDRAMIVTLQEVSPDALLNLGFGCYVNTACPRIAYDDQVRFPVPVITPEEFEIVCGQRNWDDYAVDEIR